MLNRSSTFQTALILALPLALAGCASTYSDALERYHRNQPTAFHANTLEWTAAAPDDVATTASLQAGDALPNLDDLATTSPQEAALTVAQSVFDDAGSDLAERLNSLQDEHVASAALIRNTLDWPDVALLVTLRNPSVRAAADQWRATLAQFSQAETLEALIGQYRSFTRELNVESGRPLNQEMSKRFFPFPGVLSLKGELIDRQARMARLEWERTLRDALLDAGRQYFQYQYLVRAQSTTRENIALLEDLVSVVEERYSSGRATQADLLKLQTSLERQRVMLANLEDEQSAVVAMLNALLDRSAEAPLAPPSMRNLPVTVPSGDAITRQALATRQEVLIRETQLARTQAAIRLGEVMNRPAASQGYSAFERGMRPDAASGESMTSFGQMSKAPVQPDYALSEAYLVEMRRRLDAHRSMLDQAKTQTRSMAREWLSNLAVARRRLQLLDDIVLPQNRSAYETLQASYISGRSSFLDLLDAERALIDARLEHDAALRDLNHVLVRRAAVTGCVPLPAD